MYIQFSWLLDPLDGDSILMNFFLPIWYVLIFLMGATVGSFLNVCIHRLPYEKSIFWPLGSHCGHCLQRIRWFDNIPLLSYWLLRGRCRKCKHPFSIRYFFVELFTACSFVGLFYLEIVRNVHDIKLFKDQAFWIEAGAIPVAGWIFFGYHAILLSFLIVISFCDLEHQEIPLAIPVTGMFFGLTGALLWAWPWPYTPAEAIPKNFQPAPWWAGAANQGPLLGLFPGPVWFPLPEWLGAGGNWQTGLATSFAGMLAGTFLLRAVRFCFGVGRGIEGLGMGDADLMLMAGAFLGWQVIFVAFFVSVVPGLFFGIGQLVFKGNQTLPFGPSLALGVVITWLCWRWINPFCQPFLADGLVMLFLGGGCAVFLLIAGFILGAVRGRAPEESGQHP